MDITFKTTVNAIASIAIAYLISPLGYAAVPNTDENPNTFLGPIGQIGLTKQITYDTAFSLAAEAGPKNYRLGGTFGWQIDLNNRIKASAELLRQKITYSFFDGQQSPWVNQGAIGARYEYDFRQENPYNTLLTLAAYYSHAPSTNAGTGSGTYLDNGVNTAYTLYRRIAGSNAAGLSPGITLIPWEGTNASFELNYDNVRYDTIYTRNQDKRGLGGTFNLGQALSENMNFGFTAAVRKPFTNYQANIAYNEPSAYGLWVFNLFGAYTYGKHPLPTTYNIGIGVNYQFDAVEEVEMPARTMPMPNYKDSPTYKDSPAAIQYKDTPLIALPTEWNTVDSPNKEFIAWVSKPAVYMPQVLAIPDQQKIITCTAPTVIGSGIPEQLAYGNRPYSLDSSVYFTGTGITYSATGMPAWMSINTTTGVLSGDVPPVVPEDPDNITVTATNSCGSASSTFPLYYD